MTTFQRLFRTAVFALLATTACLHAYITDNVPVKWQSSTLEMKLDLGASPTLRDGLTWNDNAISAMTEWNRNMADIKFTWTKESATTGTSTNNRNEMFFSSTPYGSVWDSYTLAVTITWYTTTKRSETDILFNSNLKWDSYRGNLIYGTNSDVILDFRRVALHELGHALGLGHPDYYGGYQPAIMNSHIGNTDTLTDDDKAGIASLYGYGPDNKPLPPVITWFSSSQTLYAGDQLNLSVYVQSYAPVTYQWKKDGVAIDGATTSNYLVAPVAVADAGTYTVDVQNIGGTTRSVPCLIAVNLPPLPTVYSLQNGTGYVGGSFEFYGSYYSVGPYPKVQWYKDGVAVPGAVYSYLNFATLVKSDGGIYKMGVTNAAGTVFSNEATLTVLDPIPPQISTGSGSISLVVGQSGNIWMNVTGTYPLTMKWYKNGHLMPNSNSYYINVLGGQIGNVDEYVLIASNAGGSVTSQTLRVETVAEQPPANSGGSYVYARKGEPASINFPYYSSTNTSDIHWFRNGVPYATASATTSLNLTSAQISDSGDYTISIKNTGGTSVMGPIHLEVYEPIMNQDGSPALFAWADYRQYGDIVYFLFGSPGRVERYDLASKKWLPRTSLGKSATCLRVNADGVYVATAAGIVKYTLTMETPVTVVTPASGTVKGFEIGSKYYVLFFDTGTQTYDVTSGALAFDYLPNYSLRLTSSTVMLDTTQTLFSPYSYYSSFSISYAIGNDGSIAPVQNSQYSFQNTMPPYQGNAYRVLLTKDQSKAVLSSGIVLNTTSGLQTKVLPDAFQDGLFLDSQFVTLAGSRLILYDDALNESGMVKLTAAASALAGRSGEISVFSSPTATGSVPSVIQVPLSSFATRPAHPVVDPANAALISPQLMMANNGILVIADPVNGNLHRWSVSELRFLPSYGLVHNMSQTTYLSKTDQFLFSFDSRQVYGVSIADGHEAMFTELAGKTRALCASDKFLFAAQSNEYGSSVYSACDESGAVLSTSNYKPDPRGFTWNQSSNHLYHLSNSYSLAWDRFDYSGFDVESREGGSNYSYNYTVPLLVSPDGQVVSDLNGTLFDGMTLNKIGALGTTIVDGVWLNNQMVTVRNNFDSALIELRDEFGFQPLVTSQVLGKALRIFNVDGGNLLVVASVNDILRFYILDGTLNVTYQSVPYTQSPTITANPVPRKMSTGSKVTFTVGLADTTGAHFQWYHNGMAIYGATSSTYSVAHAGPNDAGSYSVTITTATGMVSSTSADLQVTDQTSRLVNISTRSFVGNGDGVEIAGFYVNGTEQKEVLVRASGPALGAFQVAGVLADPVLTVYSGSTAIATNDDWQSDPVEGTRISNIATSLGAFGWPDGSKDAAVLLKLAPGSYTAIVSGKDGTTGVGLVEAYEVDHTPGSNRMVNISTRSTVHKGDNIQIAGLYILGEVPKTVLIRAAGPALTGLGVSGALSDPIVSVYDGATLVYENDDWNTGPAPELEIINAAKAVGAFAFADASADSALLVTLNPGAYTIQVRGKADTEGVALVEVYDVN